MSEWVTFSVVVRPEIVDRLNRYQDRDLFSRQQFIRRAVNDALHDFEVENFGWTTLIHSKTGDEDAPHPSSADVEKGREIKANSAETGLGEHHAESIP